LDLLLQESKRDLFSATVSFVQQFSRSASSPSSSTMTIATAAKASLTEARGSEAIRSLAETAFRPGTDSTIALTGAGLAKYGVSAQINHFARRHGGGEPTIHQPEHWGGDK
jgi:hypothetical protein